MAYKIFAWFKPKSESKMSYQEHGANHMTKANRQCSFDARRWHSWEESEGSNNHNGETEPRKPSLCPGGLYIFRSLMQLFQEIRVKRRRSGRSLENLTYVQEGLDVCNYSKWWRIRLRAENQWVGIKNKSTSQTVRLIKSWRSMLRIPIREKSRLWVLLKGMLTFFRLVC